MTAQDFADKLSRTKPASVIMVLDHREELQDQIETIQRFAVSTSINQLLLRIWWLVFQRFSEVGTLSTNTVVR